MSTAGLTQRVDDGVATLTLDRPPVNALSVGLCVAMRQAFQALSDDPAVTCVVLAGAGTRAFCAGLDFRDFVGGEAGDPAATETLVREMYEAVHGCMRPVVAAIDGPAIGAGALLAAVCDVRIATARASFVLPEINLGRIGGGAHLGRLLPQGVLRRLVFTGDALPASEAFRVGLVDEIVDGDVVEAARRMAATISAKGRLAASWAKRALNDVEGVPFGEGYRTEQRLNAEYRQTFDAQEAARAWVEKRQPHFKGW